MSINRATISGNLTRDAELRAAASGTQILTFTVAVNERKKVENRWEDYPNFIGCVMFGTRAEKLAQWLIKGTKVCVEGKLHFSSWEDNGTKRSKLEIIADEIEFMSKREGSQTAQAAPSVDTSMYDEDIPF